MAFSDSKPHYALLDALRGVGPYSWCGIMCLRDISLRAINLLSILLIMAIWLSTFSSFSQASS